MDNIHESSYQDKTIRNKQESTTIDEIFESQKNVSFGKKEILQVVRPVIDTDNSFTNSSINVI